MLLQKFSFTENQDVMTLVHPTHGILFDATNVCSILEYKRDAATILGKLDDDEKVLLKRDEYENFSDSTSSVDSGNLRPGSTKKWFVTEPGLYALTLGSEKPQAKAFKRWVTHEVLPALRRTGSYSMPTGMGTTPTDELGRMATLRGITKIQMAKEEFEAGIELAKVVGITGNMARIKAAIAVKKLYGEDVLKLIEAELVSRVQAHRVCPTDLGKPLGLSARAVNQILMNAGMQTFTRNHKDQVMWAPTEMGKDFCEIMDSGKKHSDGTPVTTLGWYETVLEHPTVKALLPNKGMPLQPLGGHEQEE